MRANKFWSCFLLTIIIVQAAWSRPAAEPDSNKLTLAKNRDVCLKKINYEQLESTEKVDALRASLQLLKFTLNAFQNLALESAKKAKTITENILKHPDILSSQSPKILEFKQNLTQFEEKYTLCAGLEDLFELVEIFSNTTDYYLETDADILEANDKLIAELLQKYGSQDLENKAWNDLKDFVPKFKRKFEHLKENLHKEEGEIARKLLQWFKRFENLPTNEERIEAFVEFFMLFEDEEEA